MLLIFKDFQQTLAERGGFERKGWRGLNAVSLPNDIILLLRMLLTNRRVTPFPHQQPFVSCKIIYTPANTPVPIRVMAFRGVKMMSRFGGKAVRPLEPVYDLWARRALGIFAVIAGRHRILQHLVDRLPRQPELPRRRPPAHPLHHHRPTHSRVQLHRLHPSGIPQKHVPCRRRDETGTRK